MRSGTPGTLLGENLHLRFYWVLTSLENSLRVSYTVKHTLATGLSKITSLCIYPREENLTTKRLEHEYSQSFISNCHKVETKCPNCDLFIQLDASQQYEETNKLLIHKQQG